MEDEGGFGIVDLFKSRALRLPLLVCVVMHLSQQLCGMVAIFYYSTEFFVKSGVKEEQGRGEVVSRSGLKLSFDHKCMCRMVL